jgi:hypothetical protein
MTARMWDLTGRELATLTRHPDHVISAVFSIDGTPVAAKKALSRMECR